MTQDSRLQTLFELLKRLSFRRGDFILSSGKPASYYMDGRLTTLSAEGAKLIGEVFYDWAKELNIDAIGGMTLGADPIVTAVSLTSALKGSPIPGFLIRKEAKGHGTGRQVEGHLPQTGRVVLVEDVITTGGSFIKAIDAVKAAAPHVEIIALFALVDRKEGAEEALSSLGIPMRSLFPIADFLAEDTSASPRPGC